MLNVLSTKDILVSLIQSIDLYNYLLKNHHRRTTVIAYYLGNQYGLDDAQIANLILTCSVHDIGALHVSERDKLLLVDAIQPEPHEILGEIMLKDFKPFQPISRIIRHHHIQYSDVESGKVSKDDVPLECYFVHLADRIDVLLETAKPGEADLRGKVVREINDRFGTVFHPDLREAFNTLAKMDEFWDNIDNDSYHDLLLMSVESKTYTINDEDVSALAALFARIVDFKSSWTMNHSKTVSMLAETIGRLVGLDEQSCYELKIAGYLHDIGKIAIPSEILDKPGPLDMMEAKQMKSHATYSSLILGELRGLDRIKTWVSGHHEKRDGTGYPLHLGSKHFPTELDVIGFADIIAALSEDRPYREAMTQQEILHVLKGFTPEKLSTDVYSIIESNFGDLFKITEDAKAEAAPKLQ